MIKYETDGFFSKSKHKGILFGLGKGNTIYFVYLK